MRKKKSPNNINEAIYEGMTSTTERLKKEEREVIFLYNEIDKVWNAHTSIPHIMRQLEKKGWTCTKIYYYQDGEVLSKDFTAPENAITIRDISKGKKPLSEKQLKNLEDMQKKNELKKKNRK